MHESTSPSLHSGVAAHAQTVGRLDHLSLVITLPYGPLPEQVSDLYLARDPEAPLACLLHGGFWRMPYGRAQLNPLATAIATRGGIHVWNVGYRRVGTGGTPWPATLDDVRASLAALPSVQRRYPGLGLRRVILVGHSAGGHLAFWAGTQASVLDLPHGIAGLIGLAPILDLMAAYDRDLGPSAVADFLGGSPSSVPERYLVASPRSLLPLRVPQWILHGDQDTAVPASMSRAYVTAAQAAGDAASYVELHGMDHMELTDPASAAFPHIMTALRAA